jgi:hypothetical protein
MDLIRPNITQTFPVLFQYIQCCDPTVYGTVDGNTVRYRNYGTPPYFVRFSQIWDRITVDYGTVYGTVHSFPRLR